MDQDLLVGNVDLIFTYHDTFKNTEYLKAVVSYAKLITSAKGDFPIHGSVKVRVPENSKIKVGSKVNILPKYFVQGNDAKKYFVIVE